MLSKSPVRFYPEGQTGHHQIDLVGVPGKHLVGFTQPIAVKPSQFAGGHQAKPDLVGDHDEAGISLADAINQFINLGYDRLLNKRGIKLVAVAAVFEENIVDQERDAVYQHGLRRADFR